MKQPSAARRLAAFIVAIERHPTHTTYVVSDPLSLGGQAFISRGERAPNVCETREEVVWLMGEAKVRAFERVLSEVT